MVHRESLGTHGKRFMDAGGGADYLGPIPGYPGWQTKASWTTDRDSQVLYLSRLVIEPDDTIPLDELGEITGRLLKAIRLRDIHERNKWFLRAAALTPEGKKPTFADPPERPRERARWPDVRLARVARDYAQLCAKQHERPIVALAKKYKEEPDIIREAIRTARKRNLLTKPTTSGRAGGRLTELAAEILNPKKGKRS